MPTKSSFHVAPLVSRTAAKRLTNKAIQAMKPGQILSDGAIDEGAGRLKAKCMDKYTIWQFIYWGGAAKRKTLSLNGKASKYSPTEREGYLTLAQARDMARGLQTLVASGVDIQIDRELERNKVKSAQVAALSAVNQSNEKHLGALLDAYVATLEVVHKAKYAREVRNTVKNHVAKPFPELYALPASQITSTDVSRILSRLAGLALAGNKGGRMAVKLRSYLSTAFGNGIGAHLDPMAPAVAGGFGLTHNPVTDVPVTKMAAAFNKRGTRTLNLSEIGYYLGHLSRIEPEVQRLALELQILAGGQRFEQLLRVKLSDVFATEWRIFDSKGRRSEPRVHWLPILPELKQRLDRLKQMNPVSDSNPEGFLFASIRGAVVQAETLSGAVRAISAHMVAKKEAVEPFRGGDIRRTCETVLAEHLSVSKDERAQLLSHGISGVQDAHYDKSKHLGSKMHNLTKWHAFLEGLFIYPVNGPVWPRARPRKATKAESASD